MSVTLPEFAVERPARATLDFEALARFTAADVAAVEETLNKLLARADQQDVIRRSGVHLVALPGKRLRPLCVALASRLGSGFGPSGRHLATAVELVHSATLLHDDVVDLGTRRRGEPTARTIYGNAASVFAGDWLLIEALRQVRAANVPGVLDELLTVIDEMIRAEAIQLEARGQIAQDAETYFAIIRGKTASLFRWALFAGARAGGSTEEEARALAAFGEHLGIAFQLVDDALDFAGDEEVTGKALFSDLREGKMTYPLIIGMERDPALVEMLRQAVSGDMDPTPIARSLARTGATAATLDHAREHAAAAVESLSIMPPSEAKDLLALVATATTERMK